MNSGSTFDYPKMSAPAIYRIRVRGHLNTDLSDRLEGMRIENLQRSNGMAESVLEGRLLDQAALSGVLNTLYELHLPVMSQAKAVAITAGASATASTSGSSAGASGGRNDATTVGEFSRGIASFTVVRGGLMYEASIGGARFSYRPVE